MNFTQLDNQALFLVFLIFCFAILVLVVFYFLIQKSVGSSFLSLSQQMQNDRDKLNNFVFEIQKKSREDQFSLQTELKESIFQNFIGFSDQINTNLKSGSQLNQKTFNNVIERLAKIDEAQKKLDSLSDDVVNLSQVLNDKKTRGIFGEAQLGQILYQIFGESRAYYSLQHKMPNNSLVDCLLYLPEPMGKMAIDSKFPLENYRRLQEAKENGLETKSIESLFKKDLKKHIDDIASKYIIPDFTSNQAVMFIPAETIYLEIHSTLLDIVEYAHHKRVWIASPTTMMAILNTVQVVVKSYKQTENIQVIQNELKLLSKDFSLWRTRWEKYNRSMDTMKKSINEIMISTEKIQKRFHKITNCDLDEIKNHDINT